MNENHAAAQQSEEICTKHLTGDSDAMKDPFARIDLNLLKALHLLLEERSVTRAADRSFITQSAMSKSLLRLRELLDDPLFVRSPRGLQPTTRALELAEPLRQIFEQVENCLMSSRFDPGVARQRVRIAAPEQFAIVTIPQLLLRFCAAAPNLKLEAQNLTDSHLENLAVGGLDFVIDLDQPYPDSFTCRRMYSAPPVLWCRKQHPLAAKDIIQIADICLYPQIMFRSLNITQDILRAIARIFEESEIILDTSHLLIALDVLMKTDALMLAPGYLSRLSILHDEIVPRRIDHIPAVDRLRLNFSLVQHERTIRSPLHKWVADEIVNIVSGTKNLE